MIELHRSVTAWCGSRHSQLAGAPDTAAPMSPLWLAASCSAIMPPMLNLHGAWNNPTRHWVKHHQSPSTRLAAMHLPQLSAAQQPRCLDRPARRRHSAPQHIRLFRQVQRANELHGGGGHAGDAQRLRGRVVCKGAGLRHTLFQGVAACGSSRLPPAPAATAGTAAATLTGQAGAGVVKHDQLPPLRQALQHRDRPVVLGAGQAVHQQQRRLAAGGIAKPVVRPLHAAWGRQEASWVSAP